MHALLLDCYYSGLSDPEHHNDLRKPDVRFLPFALSSLGARIRRTGCHIATRVDAVKDQGAAE